MVFEVSMFKFDVSLWKSLFYMIQRGDRINNPVTGEAITFLQTSADTDGKLLQMQVCVSPGGKDIPVHLHPKQEERYQIRSGWIKVTVNGEERCYGPGEDFTIAPGVPHHWCNGRRNEKLEFIKEVRPAMATEKIYEMVGVLGSLGELKEDGLPSVMQFSVIQSEYPDNIALPDSPVFLQKVFFNFVSAIARLFGYKSYIKNKHMKRKKSGNESNH